MVLYIGYVFKVYSSRAVRNIVGMHGKYSVVIVYCKCIYVYLGRYSINIYLNIPYNIPWNIYIPLDLLEYFVITA